MSSSHGSTKAIYAALAANSGIAISKFGVAIVTTSSTMMAEAIHSAADCFNQVLLLIGAKRSSRKADETHSFGYGKEEYFWSILVAVVLFLLGSLFAIYEGVEKVIEPHTVQNPYWIFGLLIFAIALEGKSFMIAFKEFSKEQKGSFIQGLKKSTNTSLVVVLIEDSAAMLGLVLAFVFTALAVYVNPVFDGFGSIVIGSILGYMSFFLSNELRKLIVGENVGRDIRRNIKRIIQDYSEHVDHINNIRAMYIGRNEFLMNISLDVDDDKRAGDIESIIFQIKQDIREMYPEALYINIEISDSKNS
jgi:cation diffusion facilitator family transporter